MVALLSGCSMIDEDLSKCDTTPDEQEYKIDYELQLVTNISTEIETQLSALSESAVAQALRDHLSGIFTDHAHDVDLSFYDTQGDSMRLYHDEHIMDASQASYILHLPKREYMHLAAANVLNNDQVDLAYGELCHRSLFSQLVRGDTIDSHTTGLFSARLPMAVLEGVDQQFSVRLYMVNCAVALVIDSNGLDTRGIRVYSRGFATSFSLCDSLYSFGIADPLVRTSRIDPSSGSKIAFCSVSFPSRKPTATRTVIESTEPFITQAGSQPLWEFVVFVTNADGTVTRTDLGIKEPVSAGQLKIIKARLLENGGLSPDVPDVAVSVALDWKEGQTYTPEI